ncbi:hypothetical protein C0431_09605 [bacterium]|nr:hypothetical protein [bacterium]
MTDGPHKSLPMNSACRRLAERAWNGTYTAAEIAECIPSALLRASDRAAIRSVAEALNPDVQTRLFPPTPIETGLQIDKIRRQFPGSAFVEQLISEAIYQVHHQPHGAPTIESCLPRVFEATYRAICGGIEEHGLQRKGDTAARVYRNRLAQGWKSFDVSKVTQTLLDPQSAARVSRRPSSKTGLDEGVSL